MLLLLLLIVTVFACDEEVVEGVANLVVLIVDGSILFALLQDEGFEGGSLSVDIGIGDNLMRRVLFNRVLVGCLSGKVSILIFNFLSRPVLMLVDDTDVGLAADLRRSLHDLMRARCLFFAY